MILRLAIFVTICVMLSVGLGMYWFWRRAPEDELWHPRLAHWGALMGFFWLVQVLFFTTFLTNVPNGLATGIVGSLGYWIAQQGVKRGGQPIYYYAMIGWLYEFLPAFLRLCGMGTIFYNLFRNPDQRWDPVAPADVPQPRGAGYVTNVTSASADLASPAHPLILSPAQRLANNRLYFVVFTIWWTVG